MAVIVLCHVIGILDLHIYDDTIAVFIISPFCTKLCFVSTHVVYEVTRKSTGPSGSDLFCVFDQ
jgi:hypothetical protein